ncbi:hypothetical protein BKA56DRAFT_609264 [Ilyonectria sp. MPI-CAGE-AT-0026]|nr:hypothetical protein BKA56DRAFT_609264 [Ilyonectria sp. MPI-CAGE-AT-0026]
MTLKMALETFSRFPELPPEIRLSIWELALRPTDRGGGLHKFSIMQVNESFGALLLRGHATLPMPPDPTEFPTYMAGVPRLIKTHHNENKPRNESACLWDAGLWAACTDSRRVITNHYNRQQCRLGNESSSAHVEIESVDNDAIAATMTISRKNEHWKLIVRPYQDLFCLTPLNWGMHIDWETMFDSFAFSASSSGYGRVKNVAVEFHPRWNFNLPKTMDELLSESTPRGLVARAVRQDVEMNLWLIDRHANRAPSTETATSSPRIFHDCEEEYIESTATEVRDSGVEYAHTAAFFIEQIESLRNPDNDPTIAFFLAMTQGIWDNMHLGILTCRPRGSEDS